MELPDFLKRDPNKKWESVDEALEACKRYDKRYGTNTVSDYIEMKEKYPFWEHDAKATFEFGRGGYNGGSLNYTIYPLKEAFLFRGEAFNDFAYMKQYCFCFPFDGIKEISKIIERLDWLDDYETEEDVDDGYGWDIEYDYNGVIFKSGGYHAWPKNYEVVVTKLQRAIEKICWKYAPDYSEEGIKERIAL